MHADELLDRDAAARMIGVRPSTLRRWAAADIGPRFLKLAECRSGRVRYRREDVAAWIASGAARIRGARPSGMPRFARPDARRDAAGRFARRSPAS